MTYVQKARLTFLGIDDELKNYASSVYSTNLNSSFYNLANKKASAKNTNKKEQAPKKILIEELPPKQKFQINIKKNILSQNEMEVKFDFSNFENITLDNLDLQIAEKAIKLKLENTKYLEKEDYDPIEMEFDFEVDVEKCSAKFNKKENNLKLILVRK